MKVFLEEELGNNTRFCLSESKNKSQFVYSSSVDAMMLSINFAHEICIKAAEEQIRKVLFSVDLGLEDKFCNAQKLRDSWSNTQLPDVLLTYLSSLVNIDQTILMKEIFEEGNSPPCDEEEDDYFENSSYHYKRINLKLKGIFQILYYQVVHGRKNLPLYFLNAYAIYEHCPTCELIAAFNRQ